MYNLWNKFSYGHASNVNSVFICFLGYASAVNCTAMPNGVYEKGCKSYTVCNGGVVTIVECPEDMVYNNQTQNCDE